MWLVFRIIATLLILSGSAAAGMFDDWTKQDWQRQAAVTALLVADWGQTRHIAKNPDNHIEINPVLGEHPSVGRVNTYFAACVVGSWIAADLLPKNCRKWFQVVLIGMEGACVGRNMSLGVKFDF